MSGSNSRIEIVFMLRSLPHQTTAVTY